MLKYKAARSAATYTKILERYSTRTCSKCSEKLPRIELGVRHWNCEKCGSVHDRDVNAAINILQSYRSGVPIGRDRPTRMKKNSR